MTSASSCPAPSSSSDDMKGAGTRFRAGRESTRIRHRQRRPVRPGLALRSADAQPRSATATDVMLHAPAPGVLAQRSTKPRPARPRTRRRVGLESWTVKHGRQVILCCVKRVKDSIKRAREKGEETWGLLMEGENWISLRPHSLDWNYTEKVGLP